MLLFPEDGGEDDPELERGSVNVTQVLRLKPVLQDRALTEQLISTYSGLENELFTVNY